MKLFKKYVRVTCICDETGNLTPRSIIWDMDNEYLIDKILEVRKAASPVGGCGILYRCIIQGKEKHLFYEIDKWFIESLCP